MHGFKPNQVVGILFVIGTVFILFYETWALAWKDDSWTITAVIRELSQTYTLFPVVVGIMIGHLFFCPCPKKKDGGSKSIEIERPASIGAKQPNALTPL